MLTHTTTCPACGQRTPLAAEQVMPSGNINLAAVKAANRGAEFRPQVDVRRFRFYAMGSCEACSAPLELHFELDSAGLETLARQHAPEAWERAEEWDGDGWLNLAQLFKALDTQLERIARRGADGVSVRRRPGAGA